MKALILVAILALPAFGQDVPYYTRGTEADQDLGGVNQNLRDLVDRSQDNVNGASVPGNKCWGSDALCYNDTTGKVSVGSKGLCFDGETDCQTEAASSSKFLQRVSSATFGCWTARGAAVPQDNTKPQITEGYQVLSATITPVNALSTITVSGTINIAEGVNNCDNSLVAALFKDADADALCVWASNAGHTNGDLEPDAMSISCPILASSTTQRVYSIRVGCAVANTVAVNCAGNTMRFGGALVSMFSLEEDRP